MDMLAITIIGVLICVIGLLAIWIDVLRRRLRDARREIASWKLAVASCEGERNSW
jgi:hypothetical protein